MRPAQGERAGRLRTQSLEDGAEQPRVLILCERTFRQLYGLLILRHSRRELLWLGVTAHPCAEWAARQLTEAYGWQQAPRYIIRDPKTSVVNCYLRCWEVHNVFSVGASAFPQNGTYNYTVTIGALMYWALDAIKNEYLKTPDHWCRHDLQSSPACCCAGRGERQSWLGL